MLNDSSNYKPNKVWSLYLVLFFFGSGLIGQQDVQLSVGGVYGTAQFQGSDNTFDGSPLIFDEWQVAKLYDVDNNVLEASEINYDALNDNMLYRQDKKTMIKLNPFKYLRFEFSDMTMVNMAQFKSNGYAKLIYDGENVKFLEKKKASKTTRDSNQYSQVSAQFKITWKTDYFLFYNGQLHPVKRKEKDLADFFDKQRIKKIVKSKKLKIKNDVDLRLLLSELEG